MAVRHDHSSLKRGAGGRRISPLKKHAMRGFSGVSSLVNYGGAVGVFGVGGVCISLPGAGP